MYSLLPDLVIELQWLEFIGQDHFPGRFFLYKSVFFPMVLALPQSSFGYWYIIKAFRVAPGIELAKQPGFCLG